MAKEGVSLTKETGGKWTMSSDSVTWTNEAFMAMSQTKRKIVLMVVLLRFDEKSKALAYAKIAPSAGDSLIRVAAGKVEYLSEKAIYGELSMKQVDTALCKKDGSERSRSGPVK